MICKYIIREAKLKASKVLPCESSAMFLYIFAQLHNEMEFCVCAFYMTINFNGFYREERAHAPRNFDNRKIFMASRPY